MRMFCTMMVAAIMASSVLIGEAQAPASAPAQPAASAPATSSDILQPALENLRQTLNGVRLEKWKKGTIRDEADSNIETIERDLRGTLPDLMKTADGAPETISKVLPVSRNVDALYDVLVHVMEAARVVAPGDQVGQLQAAMSRLEKARVRLDEQLQQIAASQEKQLSDLRSKLQTQAAQLQAAATAVAATPTASTCPAPAPAKKKKPASAKTAKPAASPTTPSSTTPASPGTAGTKPQ